MLKLLLKQIDKKQLKTAIIFAVTYNLLFNSSIYIFKFSYYNVEFFKGLLELSKEFIYISIALFITFLSFTFNRIVFVLNTFILFISGAIASYYFYFFGINPTEQVIYSAFNTHFQEADELVSIKLLLWLFLVVIIWLYLLKKTTGYSVKNISSKTLSIICFIIFLLNIAKPHYKILNSYFPIQYLHSIYKYYVKNSELVKKENIADRFDYIDNADSDILGILVIGESARYDHLGINGYQRNTTPYLNNLKNTYSFKAQSCSNHTYLSVPCMLSRQNALNIDKVNTETSILSILSKLKFNTTWIGTQSLLKYFNSNDQNKIYDEVKFAIIPGGSALFKMNAHDEVILPYIQKTLEFKGKQFLVIHLSGSHWNYDSRYPEEFANFTPTCNANANKIDPSSCALEKLINSYDNSILYTDFILHKIIEQLKDKNAFLIYVADHAESLGEKGRFGHGGELSPEQTTIPFIVWSSDTFNHNKPDISKFINKYLNKEISHDYVFHTMLDCLGIKSTIIDKNLSLCRVKHD